MIAPKRRYIPFDDTYRVPDVRVSRVVRHGDLIFACGQLDMDGEGRVQNQGDLRAQTERCMGLLYDAIQQGGASADELLQVQVFYRNEGEVEERAYAARLAALCRGEQRPVTILTPMASLSQSAEVEIDGMAVAGGAARRTKRADSGAASAVRCGNLIFAEAAAQPAALIDSLTGSLEMVGAALQDVCKLRLYTSTSRSQAERAERLVAECFAEPGPVYTRVPLAALDTEGGAVRIEAIALRGEDGARLARQHLLQKDHWKWPISLPYSQAIKCQGLIFVGGQLPVDGTGLVVHRGDMEAQTHDVMRHLGSALDSFGADFSHIAKINTFYEGREARAMWRKNVAIRCSYYAPPGPASTGIEVTALGLSGASITVDCIALVS